MGSTLTFSLIELLYVAEIAVAEAARVNGGRYDIALNSVYSVSYG
jgi:hypothetical protein